MLGLEPIQDRNSLRALDLRPKRLSKVDEVLGMCLAHHLRVPICLQLLHSELPNGFEHREPRVPICLLARRTRLISTRRRARQDIGGIVRVRDGFRGVQRPATGEDRQPPEEHLFVWRRRSWLQAIVSRKVRWRTGRSRAPPVRTEGSAPGDE